MLKTPRILLVDDDIIESMKVKRALRKLKLDIAVETCSNGEEAVSWLAKNKENLPSLILLDLNMPKMNGFEFLQFISINNELSEIPVCVLSSSDEQSDINSCFQYNILDYKVKPIRFEDYETTLFNICLQSNMKEIAV